MRRWNHARCGKHPIPQYASAFLVRVLRPAPMAHSPSVLSGHSRTAYGPLNRLLLRGRSFASEARPTPEQSCRPIHHRCSAPPRTTPSVLSPSSYSWSFNRRGIYPSITYLPSISSARHCRQSCQCRQVLRHTGVASQCFHVTHTRMKGVVGSISPIDSSEARCKIANRLRPSAGAATA